MASQLIINREGLTLVIEGQHLAVYHGNQHLKAYCLHRLEQIVCLVQPAPLSSADLDFLAQFDVCVLELHLTP